MRGTSSTLDLAFVYVDLGDDFYKFATHMMVQTARKAMPGVRVVQLTDSTTKHYPDADLVLQSDGRATKDSVCVFKGKAIAAYAAGAECPVVFSDVDMLWHSQPPMPSSGVGLMERDGFPSMPFNTGLILSASDPTAKRWFQHYGSVVEDMEKHGMGAWYADQIAAAICDGEYVRRFRMDAVCPAYGDGEGCAVHFKGPRKGDMAKTYEAMQ